MPIMLHPSGERRAQRVPTWKERMMTTGWLVAVLKRSLICALTSLSPATYRHHSRDCQVCDMVAL